MPLIFREMNGDLFTSTDDVSLAHCVSKDLSMSKGIATLFRDRFGQINELKKQSMYAPLPSPWPNVLPCVDVSVGDCAYITAADRHVFYLVTKERYYYKPTMATLEASLRVMRELCLQNGVRRLAMPRIGCGLDRLNWDQVSQLIRRIFQDDEIEITIYTM